MYSYLSDRLFVGLARRTGFPTKEQLRPIQAEQRRLQADGFSISLFSLAQWNGLLTRERSDHLMDLAREIAQQYPDYAGDVIEAPGAGLSEEAAAVPDLDADLELLPDDEDWSSRRGALGDSGVLGAAPPAAPTGPVEVAASWAPDDAVDPLELALDTTSSHFLDDDDDDDLDAFIERQARRERRARRASRRHQALSSGTHTALR